MMKKSNNLIGLKQLDYCTFLELINNNKYTKEELESYKDDDESIIEIKNEDYIKIVNDIIQKMKNYLKSNNQNLDYFFKRFVVDNNSIDLGKIVDVLKSDFKIELNQIEIFCLFSKYKIENEENNNINDEIINYQKLKSDIENKKDNNIIFEISKPINEIIGKGEKINNSFIELFTEGIKKKNQSIERAFFTFHGKMTLKKINENNYERYLDLETFKIMLKDYDININNNILNNFLLNTENIFENGKINVDNFTTLFDNEIKENTPNDYIDFDE